MSLHCIVWCCRVLYCWLRRAGCISQDTYLLYIYVQIECSAHLANLSCLHMMYLIAYYCAVIVHCDHLAKLSCLHMMYLHSSSVAWSTLSTPSLFVGNKAIFWVKFCHNQLKNSNWIWSEQLQLCGSEENGKNLRD